MQYHALFQHLGSISPTCLRAAFMRSDPKSIKIYSSHQYLFVHMGSLRIEAERKHVDEIDPECAERHQAWAVA